MTLPLSLRNRLADLILDALHDGAARRGLEAVAAVCADPPLPVGLEEAATLFEAGLYFETHEVLEPFWMRALGAEREALQGLIQVAVGFQHLANDNLDGARALLRDGATKLAGHRLDRRATSAFAAEVARCLGEIIGLGADAQARFDWSRVPRFPAED